MYKKFRFIDQGLAGDVFYPTAAGCSPTGSGLFLYGLPAFIGQNEVTYSLIKANLVSIQPHYVGTYDSAGAYSPASVLETCKLTQALCSNGGVRQTTKNNAFFALPPLRIAVGHSFGSLAVLRAARVLTTVTQIVLLAPTVHYRKKDPDYGNRADGFAILQSIRQAHPYTYRLAPDSEWDELMSGNDPLPEAVDHPTLRSVTAIVGDEDPYLSWEPLEATLPSVVRAYCGMRASLKIVRVPKAGHVLADLVEVPGVFSLTDCVSSGALEN